MQTQHFSHFWRQVTYVLGDFLQLSPVKALPAYYSNIWNTHFTLKFRLEHIKRQQDDLVYQAFFKDIRLLNYTQTVKHILASRIFTEKDLKDIPNLTFLFARRYKVKAFVQKKISRLRRDLVRYLKPLYPNNEDFTIFLEKHKPVAQKDNWLKEYEENSPEDIFLHEQIPFLLTSNTPELNFKNGTLVNLMLGQQFKGTDLVEKLKIKQVNDPTLTLYISRQDYRMEFVHDDQTTKTLNYHQFPLSYAWTLTVHKTQSLTLDKIAVDLSDF